MDRESINRLRFDRRLEQRRDWADADARAQNFESLPDVADKMTRGLDEPDEAGAADGGGETEGSAPAPSIGVGAEPTPPLATSFFSGSSEPTES